MSDVLRFEQHNFRPEDRDSLKILKIKHIWTQTTLVFIFLFYFLLGVASSAAEKQNDLFSVSPCRRCHPKQHIQQLYVRISCARIKDRYNNILFKHLANQILALCQISLTLEQSGCKNSTLRPPTNQVQFFLCVSPPTSFHHLAQA